MRKLRLPTKLYNTATLTVDLRQAIGVFFLGVSGAPEDAALYDADLTDDAPPEVDASIIAIAEAHDASIRTPEQIRDEEQASDLNALLATQAQALLGQIDTDLAAIAQERTDLATDLAQLPPTPTVAQLRAATMRLALAVDRTAEGLERVNTRQRKVIQAIRHLVR